MSLGLQFNAALQSSWKTISAALTFFDDDDDDDDDEFNCILVYYEVTFSAPVDILL